MNPSPIREIPIVSLVPRPVLEAMQQVALRCPPQGDFVEVGVYQGGSAFFLVQAARAVPGRRLYLYDTFEGMPHFTEGIDRHTLGDLADVDEEQVRLILPDAIITKGIFPQSAHPSMRHVSFAHIDVDQYQSTKESIEYLRPMMVPGGVMWFDDYGFLPGATRAIDEVLGRHRVERHAGKAIVRFPR